MGRPKKTLPEEVPSSRDQISFPFPRNLKVTFSFGDLSLADQFGDDDGKATNSIDNPFAVPVGKPMTRSNTRKRKAIDNEGIDSRAKKMRFNSHTVDLSNLFGPPTWIDGLTTDVALPANVAGSVLKHEIHHVMTVKFPLEGHSVLTKALWGAMASRGEAIMRLSLYKQQDEDTKCVVEHLSKSDPDAELSPTTQAFQNMLNREVSRLLADNKPTFSRVHDIVSNLLNCRAPHCLVCQEQHEPGVWGLTLCSLSCAKACTKIKPPIPYSPILANFATLDFLLCCVYSVAVNWTDSEDKQVLKMLLPGCPSWDMEKLVQVVESFPSLESPITISALLGDGKWQKERKQLLHWLDKNFFGRVVITGPELTVKGMHESHQMLVHRNSVKLDAPIGFPAFHGTLSDRVLSILDQGLRDIATEDQSLSLAGNPGIFYAEDLTTSRDYASRCTLDTWKSSRFHNNNAGEDASKRLCVVFGCEVRGKPPRQPWGKASTENPNKIAVRHIFLVPNDGVNAKYLQSKSVAPVMSKAFGHLRQIEDE